MGEILVTGAAGFIGSFVVKALHDKGYSVVGLDNLNDYYSVSLKRDRLKFIVPDFVEFIEGDILDKKLLDNLGKKYSFDAIVHLAAQAGVRYSIDHPDTYIQTNIQGTNNIFELARLHHIPKVVYASSSSVYGEKKKFPTRENDSLSPTNVYSLSKNFNEKITQIYCNLNNVKAIGLRFFTVYGEWGRPDMFLFKISKNLYLNLNTL